MIFTGTHDMFIYNFEMCLIKDDLRYMVIGWNERDDVELPENIEEVWFEIFNNYCSKTRTADSDMHYSVINELSYLTLRHKILVELFASINEKNRKEFAVEIRGWGFRIDDNKLLFEQQSNFEKQFRAANQDIELKQSELDKLRETNEQGEPANLFKRKIRLERITDLKIDIRTCVLDEWIEINNEAESINEEYKKQAVNHG